MLQHLALSSTFDWNRLLRPDVLWVLIPITAIVFHAVRLIIERQHAHQERMAMIERGLHPDDPRAPGGGQYSRAEYSRAEG